MAKSSAISIPCFLASLTSRSNCLTVPSPGSIASWPPSSLPIAHGLPGSSGRAFERVVPALAARAADRMDRRQVERRRSRAPRTAAAARALPRSRPTSAGRARTRSRSARARGRRRRSTPATTVFPARSPAGAASACSSVRPSCPSSTAPSDSSPARSSCPASTLRRSSSWNEATRSTHASIRNRQTPGTVDREGAAPLVVDQRLERRLPPARRAGRLRPHRGAEHVVAVAEDPCASPRPGRRPSASPDTARSRPAARPAGSGSAPAARSSSEEPRS